MKMKDSVIKWVLNPVLKNCVQNKIVASLQNNILNVGTNIYLPLVQDYRLSGWIFFSEDTNATSI